MHSLVKVILATTISTPFLSACGDWLPSLGANTKAIVLQQNTPTAVRGYELVDVDARVSDVMFNAGPTLLGSFESRRPAPRQQLGVGDVVQVTIFEAAPGGLFSPPVNAVMTGSRSAVIPNQVVDRDGSISIPYAGRIRVAGKSPNDVAHEAEQRLKERAIEPQVIVTLIQNGSLTATALGELANSGKVPLNIRGERLLDVIALAGGVRIPEHEAMVRLTRGNKTELVPLRTIMARPTENIWIQPDDVVSVLRQPQTFVALGAVSKQGQNSLDTPEMNLSDALGKAGGLMDTLSDQGGIFLFRYESATTLQALDRSKGGTSPAGGIPVVYRIRFSDPRSFHWVARFPVRNQDVIYVATAQGAEFQKFLAIITQGIVAPALTFRTFTQ